jgi:hypothetical protein
MYIGPSFTRKGKKKRKHQASIPMYLLHLRIIVGLVPLYIMSFSKLYSQTILLKEIEE